MLIALLLTIHLHQLLFGFQRPELRPNLSRRCNQTDNILKSVSIVNNYFRDDNLFFNN